MNLKIDKELFQWEKGRVVILERKDDEPEISYIQFYNKKSSYGPEIPVIDGVAEIPNYLLKEKLPIVALACVDKNGQNQVITRKTFKVLGRAKPEYYIDDNDTSKDVIYDGGVEV